MCAYVMRFIVPCKGNPDSHMVVPRDDYVNGYFGMLTFIQLFNRMFHY